MQYIQHVDVYDVDVSRCGCKSLEISGISTLPTGNGPNWQ